MNTNAASDNSHPPNKVRPIGLASGSKPELPHQATGTPVDVAALNTLLNQIRQIAHGCDRDCLQLLVILRGLETVHREIREELFQPALPDNRQALYALLRDIESEGGWPFINRMKIREFLRRMEEADGEVEAVDS
jgi:hypothetical protein